MALTEALLPHLNGLHISEKTSYTVREDDSQIFSQPAPASIPTLVSAKMRVPLDIIGLIFKHLIDDVEDTANFVAVLCTCRKLHDFCLPLVWSNLVLNNNSIIRFVQHFNSKHAHMIRSLTLAITRRRIFAPSAKHESRVVANQRQSDDEERDPEELFVEDGLKELHKALDQLVTFLPQMTSLKTFSLKVNSRRDPNCFEYFWIERQFVGLLASSLPVSAKAVELDTCGCDSDGHPESSSPERTCICEQIAHLSKRLINLRVCLQQMCPKVFTPSPTLQHLTVTLTSVQYFCTTHCGMQPFEGLVTWGPWSPDMWQLVRKTKDNLISGLNPLTEDNALQTNYPNLRTFQIIEARLSTYASQHKVLIHHDILTQTTTSMPIWWIQTLPNDPHSHFTLRRPSISARTTSTTTNTTTSRDEHTDTTAPFSDVLSLVESQAWIRNSAGARFPGYHRTTSAGTDMVWLDPAVVDPKKIPDHPRYRPYPWIEDMNGLHIEMLPDVKLLGEVNEYIVYWY